MSRAASAGSIAPVASWRLASSRLSCCTTVSICLGSSIDTGARQYGQAEPVLRSTAAPQLEQVMVRTLSLSCSTSAALSGRTKFFSLGTRRT